MAVLIVKAVQWPAAGGQTWISVEYRRREWHCEWRTNEAGELLQFQEEEITWPS